MKAIETEYNGCRFRSRLEARWAVFFDALDVKWEYEPEGFDLGHGIYYLPDFLIHHVTISHAIRIEDVDIYVEVKGLMSIEDARKVNRFYELGITSDENVMDSNPILVVGNIPSGGDIHQILSSINEEAYTDRGSFPDYFPNYYNFATVDGDYFAAYPGVDKNGVFTLFGDDWNYLCEMNETVTEMAYRMARQARFEHGEKG